MTREELFDVWVPPEAFWSGWAKPVLFAHTFWAAADTAVVLPPPPDLAAVPPADGRTLVVVDLAGSLGVSAALELAKRGYRPVPLYNAVPSPTEAGEMSAMSICDLRPIMAALYAASSGVAAAALPPDAPPAFLLDADRAVGSAGIQPSPGLFDNRSVSLPTDFPSANLLLSKGLTGVILVQASAPTPQPDLAHTLLRYQQAGMQIAVLSLTDATRTEPITVSRPPFFRRLWQRFQATFGLRRHPLGGFGGLLPVPSAG